MGERGGLVVFDSERISTGESSVLIGETTNFSKNYSEMISLMCCLAHPSKAW